MPDQSRPIDANPFGQPDWPTTEAADDAELGPDSEANEASEPVGDVLDDRSRLRGLRRGRRVRKGAEGQLIFHL